MTSNSTIIINRHFFTFIKGRVNVFYMSQYKPLTAYQR